MQTITINVKNEALVDKVLWLLEHFQKDGLEIVSKEDIDDLKLLKATRDEACISFEEYTTMKETDYLLSSPANRKRLLKSLSSTS